MSDAHRAPALPKCKAPSGLMALLVGGTLTTVYAVAPGALDAVDRPVWAWLVDHRPASLFTFMDLVSKSGSIMVVTVLTAILTAMLVATRRWIPAITVALTMAAAGDLTWTMKSAFGRERPPADEMLGLVERGFAFPSGHSLTSAALAVMGASTIALVLPRLRRPAIAFAVTSTLLIGGSRLYLGVHWLTDVLAGWAIGAGLASIAIAAAVTLERAARDRSTRDEEPLDAVRH